MLGIKVCAFVVSLLWMAGCGEWGRLIVVLWWKNVNIFQSFFTRICMSSSFSQSALVRFSRGISQKFFQIFSFKASISAACASVTTPVAVLYMVTPPCVHANEVGI